MSDLQKIIPTKLLWVDLEMTGLDPNKDVIIEVAAEVTDFEFKTLGSYESLVGHPQKLLEERMQANVWWKDYPANRDNFLKNVPTAPSSDQVQKELIAFIEEHFGDEPAVLAGNSIHSDKKFIEKWWPGVDLKLHYRMLDVTSFKILMQGQGRGEYTKKGIHRAFDDIQASIAELQFYIDKLKKHD
jgi:oligoribonuclease